MAETAALIHYVCANAEHEEHRSDESDTLTIHAGKWAYCARDVRAKDHLWTETGGVTLAQLQLGQRRPAKERA
ncbi:MAG TPA: hypothetical protein VJQ09_04430 [Candidatus Limnocylindria bacterium]|nr:hypothetical protein [Candidatus Limnocylindria bacterium]